MAAMRPNGPSFELLCTRVQEGLVAIFSQKTIEIAPIVEYVGL